VDDSENFAIIDEQQADTARPVAKDNYNDNYDSGYGQDASDEKPLAHDEPTSSNSTKSRVELLDQVQGMQQDIQELRGQLEVQSHDLKVLKDQQLAYYKDLDARLHQAPPATNSVKPLPATELSNNQVSIPGGAQPAMQIGGAVNPAPSNAHTSSSASGSFAATPASNSNPAEEQISYMAAYELVNNKQFDEAINAMQAFVKQYPNGGYTANAQYWLGELYMVKQNYPEAIEHFNIVLNQYPSSSKAAASLLKVGYALAASGKNSEAKQKLSQVLKNYPDTPTADLAAAKLKALNAS
jgi:tol-pal system protein YbgF